MNCLAGRLVVFQEFRITPSPALDIFPRQQGVVARTKSRDVKTSVLIAQRRCVMFQCASSRGARKYNDSCIGSGLVTVDDRTLDLRCGGTGDDLNSNRSICKLRTSLGNIASANANSLDEKRL